MFNIGIYRNARRGGPLLNLTEHRAKPQSITDLLPWAFLLQPDLVINKDGSFMSVLTYRGNDLDSSSRGQLISARGQINNILRRFGSSWCLHIEARRRAASAYPDSQFPDPISQAIDDNRRAQFAEEAGSAFESDYFLTFTYLPPSDRIGKAEAALVENARRSSTDESYIAEKKRFTQAVAQVAVLLASTMPMVRMLSGDALVTYLHDCISERPGHYVACPAVPFGLDALLPDSSLLGGLEPMLGNKHLRTIGINAFPGRTVVGLLDELNRVPFDYRWSTRFIPLDKTDAEKALRTMRTRWFAKRKGPGSIIREAITGEEPRLEDSDALNKAGEVQEAQQILGGDLASYGYFTQTITIMDEDLDRLEWKRKELVRILDSRGFVSFVESINAVEAWLSSLPGHAYANVRRPLMSSLNLADMMPISAVWGGHNTVHFMEDLPLPAIAVTHTNGTTPFHLALHQGDVGHTMIAGKTGSGKSVLLNFLASQFRRYPDARVIIFDNGRSTLVSTLLAGGQFYALGSDDAFTLQPLADVDIETDRIWAVDWIVSLLEEQSIPVTPEMKAEVWGALLSLASYPREQRTLSLLRSLIQNHPVKIGLDPFVIGGPYGALLDASENTLAMADWLCFEMGPLYERPRAIAPTLAYLFHALQKSFDGRPTILILDEAWLFLDHPVFAAKIREWLKTLRRLKVSVVFATQQLADISRNKIAPALIENCDTRILLPNDKALDPEVRANYDAFGLSSRQIEILARATPKHDYYYTSAAGNRLFSLGLSPLALAAFGTNSKPELEKVDRLLATHGRDGFARAFLASKGFNLSDSGQITRLPFNMEKGALADVED